MLELLTLAGVAALLALALVAALTLPGRVAAATRAGQADRLDALERGLERVERSLRGELAAGRDEAGRAGAALRGEVAAGLARLTEASEARGEALRLAVEERLSRLQADNGARLEEMRRTVDERLQGTLERRLGESFRLVSERLEAVQRGLGEMQALATGVGDLKKVLANVKVRGTWGEVQLGALLAQVLSPEQFLVNAAPRPGSAERVEFCVRLPGRDEGGEEVLLPIDAKFPLEDWQRLVEASERADAPGVEAAGKALEQRLVGCARDIHDKYVCPPHTTDFGLLFLPTEGLYAEVVRRPGLLEALQRDWKVSVAGPTTLLALLTSLQMGFRTLAIQRRSAEVWQVLGAVKGEFATFGAVLEKVEKKLQEAQNQIHQVGVRRRALERTLREVEAAPGAGALPGDDAPGPAGEGGEPEG
jgi:DNA recombination protein RmuC